ncbi:TRAF3-interacting JNK-activating modulator [Poecilia formosa]|uniref:TRAF3-interacting JNK-activating modulator-like n=2 Tax=Poecilia formosa TaxID=48698 RepID=A0A087Y727_POEFO|nr:PREDICTED: TRAF3-interacting JNK-activating modulator-like [Poecilia formosa]XP_016536606.1 PREDICTED: TRAF3-interacting JNK-activating modulator-like [Poecilia formosa]XP_016536607.1 PREDICTED: TRAF3-interacting JNK-activating modulator-like [Poecilia formosa]
MEHLDFGVTRHFQEREFDRKVDYRAERREYLRGRNNVTLCRSPTRELDTRQIKTQLKQKRQWEFLNRRSLSPEPQSSKCIICSTDLYSLSESHLYRLYRSRSKSEKPLTKTQRLSSADGHQEMILTPERGSDCLSNNKWALLWSESTPATKEEKGQARKQTSTSATETSQHRRKTQNTSTNTVNKTATIHQKSSAQTEKKIRKEISVQTESGFVTVKESEVQRLSDYLQEALWREETVKKKLAVLTEISTNLVNSSDVLWTSRCSEDLLRSKIKVLEAQLQVCLQKFPKDGVKKLMLQMEKQRGTYEEKALVALQKATQEKADALCQAETLQEALVTAQAEALRWQSLYKELMLSSGQLRENHHLSNDQLQQLHTEVQLSRAREAELRGEVTSLRQEKQELQYNICLLEEDNQALRDEIQNLRDGGDEGQSFFVPERLESGDVEPKPTVRRDSQVEEELRLTQEKLQLKEKECEELQTELHAMEQECQSSQARLSQCRDELRQLSHRRRRPMLCSSWWRICLFFLLLLAVAGVAMLWSWHPPFREQVEVLCADIETRIEDYLMEMASPQNSGCFRPI